MILRNKPELLSLEDAGRVSAIWILSCNDENPIISYESVRRRLDLPFTYDVERLVKNRSELFRQGAPKWRLDEWKQSMRRGVQVPSWIKNLPEAERARAIDSFEAKDVFRSQFRVNRNMEKSPTELIEWGLQHIERLRKASVEEREMRSKWIKEVIIPGMSIAVAIVAVMASGLLQYFTIKSQETSRKEDLAAQTQLKKYEVSFDGRNNGYASLMQSFEAAFEAALVGDKAKMLAELNRMELGYYKIRPFLNREVQLAFAGNQSAYRGFLDELANREQPVQFSERDKVKKNHFKAFFGETIYEQTFEKSEYVVGPLLWPVR